MTTLPIRRGLAVLGAALMLGGAAVGVVSAQTPPGATPTTPAGPSASTPGQPRGQQAEQQFLDTLGAKLGVTSDALKKAIADTRQSLGLPDRGPAFGFGFGGPGRAGGPGGPGFDPSFDAAARVIGVTVDQLRQELPGKSLTDVATAHNVDPNAVAAALKAAEAARIDKAVTDGRLTADQAAQRKLDANTRIDQLMTQALPAGGSGGPGGRGAPGGPDGRGRPGMPGGARTPGTPAPSATPGA